MDPSEATPDTLAEAPRAQRIKDLEASARPREKLLERGPTALTDAELIGIFLRTGIQGQNAVEIGRQMLRRFGSLTQLSRASIRDLCGVRGLGKDKSALIAAVFELGKRLARESLPEDQPLETPAQLHTLLGAEMRALPREELRVVLLNSRHCLLRVETVLRGTLDSIAVHYREIIQPVLAHHAKGLFLVHNHPSGDCAPSSHDMNFTRQMADLCRVLDLRLRDHLIIGQPSELYPMGYFSFRGAGFLS